MTNDDTPRILILDDEPLVSAALVRAVRASRPDWEVIEAASPAQALGYVISEEITAFVCSQELLGESGTDVLAQAKTLAPETVGILLTSRGEAETLLEAINVAGVFRCLMKPFPEARLLADLNDAAHEHRRRAALRALLRTVRPDVSRRVGAPSGN